MINNVPRIYTVRIAMDVPQNPECKGVGTYSTVHA